VVKVRTDTYNQEGALVATFRRSVLIPKRVPAAASGGAGLEPPPD
jgi:hypothetical protein